MGTEFDVRNRIDRESVTAETPNSIEESTNDFTVQNLPSELNFDRNEPELFL